MKKIKFIVSLLLVLTFTSCHDNGKSEMERWVNSFNPPKYILYHGEGWGYKAFYCGFESYEKTTNTYKLYDKNKKMIIEYDISHIKGVRIVLWENKPSSKKSMIHNFKYYGMCPDCW